MPTSATVVSALCVRNVFLYDGGGGRFLVVGHRSNDASIDARLPFKPNERLSIDPAVLIGRVSQPLHQRLRSLAHLPPLQLRLDAVQFIFPYSHHLKFRFVEGPVKHLSEIVCQPVQGWIGGMNLVYGEELLAPIRHVVFHEMVLRFTDAHAIRHSKRWYALTVVSVQALPQLLLVRRVHRSWSERFRNAYAAMVGVVVQSSSPEARQCFVV